MNNAIKNRMLTGLVVFLLLANAGTILLFWINRPSKSQVQKGSPKDFLVHELELDSSQLGAFSLLIENHQSAARDLKRDITSAKEDLFQLLKQPVIAETQQKKTIEGLTSKVQQLELLNLAHFQQVRALCNDKQKKKFDGLLDQLAGMMAEARPPKAGMQAPPPNGDGHHPTLVNDSNHSSSPNANKRHLPPSNEEGHRPPPPPGADGSHPPPPTGEGHHPPPPNGVGHHPPPPRGEGHRPPPPPKGDGHHPPPPLPDQY